jgi:hypothetical protein
MALWFILFVRRAGWSLKYKHDVWIVCFQILRSFLRRPHPDRFPDDIPVKVTANRNRDSCEKKPTGTKKQEFEGFLQELPT